jgi:hypothetical protein
MSAGFFGHTNKLSDSARNAFQDLETLGYDVDALGRRNMSDQEVVDLRDKAFRYRGIEIPRYKGMADMEKLFELGVKVSLRSSPEEARTMARHILYLAEKQLAEM